MANLAIDIRKPLEQRSISVDVTLTREFRFRMWLGTALMKWATRVLTGVNGAFNINIHEPQPQPHELTDAQRAAEAAELTSAIKRGETPDPQKLRDILAPGTQYAPKDTLAFNPGYLTQLLTRYKAGQSLCPKDCDVDQVCLHSPCRYGLVDTFMKELGVKTIEQEASAQEKAECDCKEFHGGKCTYPICSAGVKAIKQPHIAEFVRSQLQPISMGGHNVPVDTQQMVKDDFNQAASTQLDKEFVAQGEVFPCTFIGCNEPDGSKCRHWPRSQLTFPNRPIYPPGAMGGPIDPTKPYIVGERDLSDCTLTAEQKRKLDNLPRDEVGMIITTAQALPADPVIRENITSIAGRAMRFTATSGLPDFIRPEFQDRRFTAVEAAEQVGDELVITAAQVTPMLLFCPACHTQHIDAPNPELSWTNPPHRSHLCHCCGWIWRPADVCTTGVATITTAGKNDRTANPREVHGNVRS